jgi:hypothetical protein
MVWRPGAESEIQAEAILEYALGCAPALAGVLVLAECSGGEGTTLSRGASAIIHARRDRRRVRGGEDDEVLWSTSRSRSARPRARHGPAGASSPLLASASRPRRTQAEPRVSGRPVLASPHPVAIESSCMAGAAHACARGVATGVSPAIERVFRMARPKVTVVGAGQVGATTAFLMLNKGIADVVMIDVAEGLPQGKALDMMHSRSVERFAPSRLGHQRLRRHRRLRRGGGDGRAAAQAGHDPRRPARRQRRDRALGDRCGRRGIA